MCAATSVDIRTSSNKVSTVRNGVLKNKGYHFLGPHTQDCSILKSIDLYTYIILGSPCFGKLPSLTCTYPGPPKSYRMRFHLAMPPNSPRAIFALESNKRVFQGAQFGETSSLVKGRSTTRSPNPKIPNPQAPNPEPNLASSRKSHPPRSLNPKP